MARLVNSSFRLTALGFFAFALLLSLRWILFVFNSATIHRPNPHEHEMKELWATVIEDEVEIKGWERGKSRDPKAYLLPYQDTTIISGDEICTPETSIVVICTSRPSSWVSRTTIRNTWASVKLPHVKIVFFVGVPNHKLQNSLEDENHHYHDIVQENFTDTYMNLTLKSILLLKWYIRRCPESSYVMKVDDDTFVDLKNLNHQLKHYPTRGALLGFLYTYAEVVRNVKDKWYVPRYMYPHSRYPPYLDGPAYIMSKDVALKLYATALETPIFHLEDVYLTGICAHFANIKPRHFIKSVKFWRTTGPYIFSRMCTRYHITCHPLYPWQLRQLWKMRNSVNDSI